MRILPEVPDYGLLQVKLISVGGLMAHPRFSAVNRFLLPCAIKKLQLSATFPLVPTVATNFDNHDNCFEYPIICVKRQFSRSF